LPKEVKLEIDMTIGMAAKQLGEWETDPSFEELTNLGSSENPDVETMSEVVLEDATDFEDDFGVMYSAEEEEEVFKCSCGGNLIIEEVLFVECDQCGATDYQAEDECEHDWVATAYQCQNKGCDAVVHEGDTEDVGECVATITGQDTDHWWKPGNFVCQDCGLKEEFEEESYADFFTQMEDLLVSTAGSRNWTLEATTDSINPDSVEMTVKFTPTDPSTFFDIIE